MNPTPRQDDPAFGTSPDADRPELSPDAARREASERDASTLQPPAGSGLEHPPGDDGGTRTKRGSNYGDWVPDKRAPEHPAIRQPEERPLVPPPPGTSPLQGEFERGDNDPLVK